MQLLAIRSMSHMPKKLGQGQQQVLGHGWKFPTRANCIRDAAGAGDGKARRNTVRGRAGEGHHFQPEGGDQSEEGRRTQAATRGHTTGRGENGAHAGGYASDQEKAGIGGGESKGGLGEGDVRGVQGVPELRYVLLARCPRTKRATCGGRDSEGGS